MTEQELATMSAEAARINSTFLELDDKHTLRVDMTYATSAGSAPVRECYAVLYKSSNNWKVGRFYPGSPAMFASDASSPDEVFREIEKLRRRRPVDLEKAWVLPILGMHKRLR